jgi:hypothetical protein
MDLAHSCRIFHPTDAQYTFFSAAHGPFSKMDHILGHKASLSKYEKIEIITCIISDHNTLKVEINNINSIKKHANNWKLNNTWLSDQWVIDEIKEEIKKFMEVNENENMAYWTLQNTTKAALRGKFIAMTAYFKISKRSQVNDLMLHLKLREKQDQVCLKTSRRREIIKISAEINEIETKKTISRFNETKCWFFDKANKIDRPLANMTKMRRE